MAQSGHWADQRRMTGSDPKRTRGSETFRPPGPVFLGNLRFSARKILQSFLWLELPALKRGTGAVSIFLRLRGFRAGNRVGDDAKNPISPRWEAIFEIAWPRELPEAREFAAAGLVRHTAEYAAILDEDGNLVETVKDRA